MTGDASNPSEDLTVSAILVQRSHADEAELLDVLVTLLADSVPGVHVERALLRRHVTSIRVPLDGYTYVLKRTATDSYEASRQQEVRGVTVRTVPLDLDVFLEELGLALDVELRRTERGRAALQRWLSST